MILLPVIFAVETILVLSSVELMKEDQRDQYPVITSDDLGGDHSIVHYLAWATQFDW